MSLPNFLHAYAEVEITDGQNKWFFNAPENPFLTGVTIVTSTAAGGFGIPTMTISFSAPYKEGIEMIESGIFRQMNKVSARIGYVGGNATPWWKGALNQGGDGLQLTTDGLEGGVTVQLVADTTWNDIPAPDLKDKDGVSFYNMVSKALGCKLTLSPKAFQFIADKHYDKDDVNRFAWAGFPASKNAWEWLLFLNQTYDFETIIAFGDDGIRRLYVLTHDEAYLGVMDKLDGVTQTTINQRTYRLRGILDPANDEYPIFTFGPDPGIARWDGLMPPGGGGGVYSSVCNERSGDVLAITAPPVEQTTPASVGVENPDARANIDPDQEFDAIADTQPYYGMGYALSQPAPPPPAAKATDNATVEVATKAVAQQRQAEGNAAQKATITTVGVPEEFPGNRIDVQGCSKRYNGRYMIWNITHQYAGGMWDMTLVVQRDGVGGDGFATGVEAVVPLAGTVEE